MEAASVAALEDLLDEQFERAAELIRFLALADLAKFDDRDGLQPPLPDPELGPEWFFTLVGSTSPPSIPAAGARSRINGK